MSCDHNKKCMDEAKPYVMDMGQMAENNSNFRREIWTGCYMQMTLMCIPPCGDVGLEIHHDTDQFIRVECGKALVKMGKCRERQDFERNMCAGDAVFIPAGTWHNIINIGKNPLKLSSVYAPPHHLRGTVHCTKADAEKEEY